MAFKIWHFTPFCYVEPIRTDGFRDGDQGFVWFTTAGDTHHDLIVRVLLEVTLDVDERALVPFAMRVVDRTRWDEETRSMVATDDPALIYRRTDYKIPAAFVNAHAIGIRLVPSEEYRKAPSSLA